MSFRGKGTIDDAGGNLDRQCSLISALQVGFSSVVAASLDSLSPSPGIGDVGEKAESGSGEFLSRLVRGEAFSDLSIPEGGRPDGAPVLLVASVHPAMSNDARRSDEFVVGLAAIVCGGRSVRHLRADRVDNAYINKDDNKDDDDCVPTSPAGTDGLPLSADPGPFPDVESWVGSLLLLSGAGAVDGLDDALLNSAGKKSNQPLEKMEVDANMGVRLDAWHAVLVQVPLKRGRRTQPTDGDNSDDPWCGGAVPWPPPPEGGTASPPLFGFVPLSFFLPQPGLGSEMGVDASLIVGGVTLVSEAQQPPPMSLPLSPSPSVPIVQRRRGGGGRHHPRQCPLADPPCGSDEDDDIVIITTAPVPVPGPASVPTPPPSRRTTCRRGPPHAMTEGESHAYLRRLVRSCSGLESDGDSSSGGDDYGWEDHGMVDGSGAVTGRRRQWRQQRRRRGERDGAIYPQAPLGQIWIEASGSPSPSGEEVASKNDGGDPNGAPWFPTNGESASINGGGTLLGRRWVWDEGYYTDGEGYTSLNQDDGGEVKVSVSRLKCGKQLQNGWVGTAHQPISPNLDESGRNNPSSSRRAYCLCGVRHSKEKENKDLNNLVGGGDVVQSSRKRRSERTGSSVHMSTVSFFLSLLLSSFILLSNCLYYGGTVRGTANYWPL